MRLLALALTLAATAVLADEPKASKDSKDDDCNVTPGPGDVVKKHGDIVIEAGRHAEDVIALDGSITLKKGADVKSAIALKGNVNVEAGATVRDSAISLKGAVLPEKGSKVKNSIEINRKGIRIVGDDGDVLDFNIGINGNTLGKAIVSSALSKVKNCKVIEQD